MIGFNPRYGSHTIGSIFFGCSRFTLRLQQTLTGSDWSFFEIEPLRVV